MNWYRFKIELLAWISTTALCVLSAMTALTLMHPPPKHSWREYPLSLRFVAENEHLFPYIALGLLASLWVLRWKVLRIVRGFDRYQHR